MFHRVSRDEKLELFCSKDFHHYEGVDVCLVFCRKRVCSVYKTFSVRKRRRGVMSEVERKRNVAKVALFSEQLFKHERGY